MDINTATTAELLRYQEFLLAELNRDLTPEEVGDVNARLDDVLIRLLALD